MKTTQLGFGKDFGLVGNNIRRYLQTTALTATGLMAIAAPAAADNWTDHVADVGSISIDTGTPNTTNITQNTDFVKVHGDGDINAGWTVNVAQPTSSSKYVLYDVEGDATHIRGNLNANGEVYIFDQNGVIFGDDAVVNVGSIVTSTGYISDANIQGGNLVFENVDGGGDTEIVNRGQISVADAGLAAFVAPTVKNSGVIKAKMGKVVLASGKKVTLDLYGDDLVSIAADDALGNALVKNSGTINAEGGTVVLSAQAAKAAVDNVINMSGVINVSSATMQGGKIVLSGGKTGTVHVSGKMKAGGTTGGDINVSGENIKVTNTGRLKTTTGGKIDLSATSSVDPETTTDAGNILVNGIIDAEGGDIALAQTGYFDGDADSLRTSGTGTISVEQNKRGVFGSIQNAIDAIQNLGTGTNTVKVGAGTYDEDVVLSEDNFILRGANAGTSGSGARGAESIITPHSPGIYVTSNNNIIDGFEITGPGADDGIWVDGGSNNAVVNNYIHGVAGNGILYTNASGTNNIAGNKIDSTGINGVSVNGNGLFTVENNEIGTDGDIYGNGVLLKNTMFAKVRNNLISNTVQDEPTGDNASGVYVFSGLENTVEGNIIRNVDWDGVKVFGGTGNIVQNNDIAHSTRVGIWGYLTNALQVLNNLVVDSNVTAGIGIEGGKDVLVQGNTVKETHEGGFRADGISFKDTKGSVTVTGNTVGAEDGSSDIEGNGIALYYINNALVQGNFIYHTKTVNPDRASGIYVNNGYNNLIDDNTIRHADWDGIKIFGGKGNIVQNNDIAHSTRVGIWGYLTNALQVLNNLVVDSNVTAGIGIEGGKDVLVQGNTVKETHDHGYLADGISIRKTNGVVKVIGNTVGDVDNLSKIEGNGIALYEIDDAIVQGNDIFNTKTTLWDGTHASGIYVFKGSRNLIGGLGEDEGNYIRNANWDGIKIHAGNENTVIGNDIAHSTRVGIYGVATNNLHILNNLVRDSNVTAGIGVEYTNSTNIENNDVGDSVGDGILANVVNGNVRITGNTVNQSTDDGIEVKNSQAYVYISGNTVDNSGFGGADEFGGDGISVRNVSPNYYVAPDVHEGDAGYGEYNVVVYDNNVSNSADDGIEIAGADAYPISMLTKVVYDEEGPYEYHPPMGRVLVMNNDVNNSGYGFGGYYGIEDGYGSDGIHVRNVYPEGFASAGVSEGGFYGYSVDVIGNDVWNSGDDGIEVLNTYSTYIANNSVNNSGLYDEGESEEGPVFDLFAYEGSGYDTGDYPWGADGIHVRNVWSNNEYYSAGKISEGEGDEYYEYYRPYSVVIDGNTVNNSLDDGIQVLFSGDTLVQNNGVTNSGFGPDERLFGGDGINIVNGINPYDEYYYFSPEYWSWMDIRPTTAEVYNNIVDNSADDGIEVVGATSVWVDGNDVSNSGDDGINVLGFAGFYGDEEAPVEEAFDKVSYFYSEWPYFYTQISDNTVDNSGGDGIEVRGFDEAYIYANDVSNSTANGLFVSGFNNGSVDVYGNTFDGFDIGGNFESGVIDLTGESNTFRNGRVGLRFAPYSFGDGEEEVFAFSLPATIYDWIFPYPFSVPTSGFAPLALVDDDAPGVDPYVPGVAPTNFGGTIGAQIFENITQYYVELDNEAFFAPGFPTWLNGMNSSYDGLVPADDADGILDQATYDALEAKFFHYIDRQDLGLFFFGLREEDAPDINQNLIFNRFAAFNGDITGLNVRILGLPNIPGGGNPVNFNAITPAAGGNGGNGGNNPGDLNNITPAAGGNGENGGNNPANLNNIETQAGGENDACWSSAMNTAGSGQVVNVVYNGSFADNLNQAAACGGTF